MNAIFKPPLTQADPAAWGDHDWMPPTSLIGKFTFYMCRAIVRRQYAHNSKMDIAIERISTVLDSVDLRLARPEANYAHH